LFYEFDLVLPKNTTEQVPVTLTVQLNPGRLVGVSVQFPRGCVGLAETVARRASHQLFPTNTDGTVRGENAIIAWAEDQVLEEEPYLLELVGWNADDSWPHTLTWRFNILPIEPVLADRERLVQADRLRARALGEED
jgi:hypothetical protein